VGGRLDDNYSKRQKLEVVTRTNDQKFQNLSQKKIYQKKIYESVFLPKMIAQKLQ
jgi:hypothetical protein